MKTATRFLLAGLLALPLAAALAAPAAAVGVTPGARPVDPSIIGTTPDGRLYARDRLVVRLSANSASLRAMRPGAAGRYSLGGTALESAMRNAGVSSVQPAVTEALSGGIPRAFGLDERWLVLELGAGQDAFDVARQLRNQTGVEWAEPDWVLAETAIPNDPQYNLNWGHNNSGVFKAYGWMSGTHDSTVITTSGFDVNAQAAWSEPQGYGSTSVIIGIIDSGVDIDHPDLSPNLVQGWDFTSNDNNPDEATDAHGTECAGIAAAVANNALGVAGIAGNCRIMPLRAQSSPGFISSLFAGRAILYATNNGAKILSMSFGGGALGDFFRRAAASADSAGLLMFAATGNENKPTISFPAAYPMVIGVGAASPCASRKRSSKWPGHVNPGVAVDSLDTSCDNEFWWGSNWGIATVNDSAAVDLIAPTELPSTDILGAGGSPGDYVSYFNGTSCATPYAAGVAALVWSRFPALTAAQVRDRLKATAIDISDVQTPLGWDKYTGYGMVDAYAAVLAPDLVPYTPGGWDSPVVPRATNDSPGVLSPTLPGDATTYISSSIANLGGGWGLAPGNWALRLDGADFIYINFPTTPAWWYWYYANYPTFVRGGLHTLEMQVDPGNTNIETNESNNGYARQYSWIPADLPIDTHVVRAGPPDYTGGWGSIVGPAYYNVDGLRLQPRAGGDGYWRGAALRAEAGSYDLLMFDQATGTGDGFRAFTTYSALVGDVTNFVITNYNHASIVPRDIGILNYNGSGVAHAEHRQSPSPIALGLGANLTGVPLAQDQMLYLQEYFHVPDPATPRILFQLITAPSQKLRLALFDNTTVVASRPDAMSEVVTDVNGRANIDIALPTTGGASFYGLAVFRDAGEGGTAPLTFDLRIRATPAELANTMPGWFGPIVPTNGGYDPTVVPAALDGNTGNTNMFFGYTNSGTVNATGFQVQLLLDGAELLAFAPGDLGSGLSMGWYDPGVTVRGGRHTLGYKLDVTNAIDEVDETNNAAGVQYVWSPLPLALNTPVDRASPPDATGGWGEVAGPAYYDDDGLRSPLFVPAGANGYWGAVAVTPGSASDVDMDWFGVSAGPTDGFVAPLATAGDGGERTDLLITDLASSLQFDVGVRKQTGGADYTLEAATSVGVGTDPALIGPLTIPAGEILRVFEFFRTATNPLQVLLENLSGNANLGFGIYGSWDGAFSPFDKATGIAYADAGGAGANELSIVNANLSGAYLAIAVWKTQRSEIAKNATFQLHLNTPTTTGVGDPLPKTLAFSIVGANPVSDGTRLRFDLPEPREVALEVYDLQGHRLKTLARGMSEAGVHRLAWDGRDEGGRPLGNGVYFVRFASGNYQRVSKLSLLR